MAPADGIGNDSVEMPFIISDGIGSTETDKRKMIRRYVMLGKNRGKTRKMKQGDHQPVPSDLESYKNSEAMSIGLSINMRYSHIPQKVGSELSFTQFADSVEPALIKDILKFSFIAKRVIYPLERCINFDRKDNFDRMWFELMTQDAAYLHTVVFASQTYFMHTSNQESPEAGKRAIMHHSRALQLLRERLAAKDEELKISDPTILVVLALAGHAHMVNDSETAKKHIDGLRRIVDLRGGLSTFSYHPKLSIELLKCDLGIALSYGTKTVFFTEPSSESLMLYPDFKQFMTQHSHSAQNETYSNLEHLNIDEELGKSWDALRRFCSVINSASEHKRRLPKEILLNTMAPIMYRLFNMAFESGSFNEVIRLVQLAFSSHAFLHWQGVKYPHTYLPESYRNCLLRLKFPSESSPHILCWLLVMGAISIFSPADDVWLIPWIQVNLKLCEAESWNMLRHQLKQFLWIDILHDHLGKSIFDVANSLHKDDESSELHEEQTKRLTPVLET
ncbi:hypothetical protein TrVGV298_002457 [Trichoderma virens]|nr:hypothetical protein TrVGV298_002457 [Trichoderma virens]